MVGLGVGLELGIGLGLGLALTLTLTLTLTLAQVPQGVHASLSGIPCWSNPHPNPSPNPSPNPTPTPNLAPSNIPSPYTLYRYPVVVHRRGRLRVRLRQAERRPVHAGAHRALVSPLYLPCISLVSPLYLPYISPYMQELIVRWYQFGLTPNPSPNPSPTPTPTPTPN